MTGVAQRTKHRRGQRLMQPFLRFAQLESASSIVLLLATVVALLVANSPLGSAYESLLEQTAGRGHLSIHSFVNDGLMAIFFLLVGLEVKREFLSGTLQSLRRALLPVLAALGGVVTPASLYLSLNVALKGSGSAARG